MQSHFHFRDMFLYVIWIRFFFSMSFTCIIIAHAYIVVFLCIPCKCMQAHSHLFSSDWSESVMNPCICSSHSLSTTKLICFWHRYSLLFIFLPLHLLQECFLKFNIKGQLRILRIEINTLHNKRRSASRGVYLVIHRCLWCYFLGTIYKNSRLKLGM